MEELDKLLEGLTPKERVFLQELFEAGIEQIGAARRGDGKPAEEPPEPGSMTLKPNEVNAVGQNGAVTEAPRNSTGKSTMRFP